MDERRRYRRIQAPVLCRPAGQPFLSMGRAALDVSLGGARVYSDVPYEKGERLKLELFLAGAEVLTFTAEIVWIEELPEGAPARFDIGIKFVSVDDETKRKLADVLGPLDD